MNQDRHIWRVWASFLQRWGVSDGVADILEAAGQLSLLGAQAVYLGQPLLKHALPEDQLDALARLLEEPTQTQAFVRVLRESTSL